MSRCANSDELVRVLIRHLRQHVDVRRALVFSNHGLSSPKYRLVHRVDDEEKAIDSGITLDDLREGGLVAQILYRGELHYIARFEPDPSDPVFDLLRGCASLLACPLFEEGDVAGTVVLLGASPQQYRDADVCTLAIMTSLLGRAIEAQTLAGRLQTTCRALDTELVAAAAVQRWLLPACLAVTDHADIAASYRAASHCGGDYYDLGELSDGRSGVLIADVTGHGAAAAVIVAVLRTILHELNLSHVTGPAALLDHADHRLCALGLSDHGLFVTAFACALDRATGVMTYSSAGHNPPRLLRVRPRTIESLDGANALPLGVLDQPCKHNEQTIVLAPDDLALLYTDGITETASPDGEFFGTRRLDETLMALPEPVSASSAVQAVANAVQAFAEGKPQADDQTLLAIRR